MQRGNGATAVGQLIQTVSWVTSVLAYGCAWPDPCPASPDPNSSVILFCVVAWRPGMLTVIIIVAIILVALYIMRDRLPQLRR